MLQVSNLEKAYGGQVLFHDVSFCLNDGERLGIVGRNGCGKSTLFRMILEEEHADSGTISLPRYYKVGHLSQHLSFHEESILKEACLGLGSVDCGEEYKAEIILSGLGFTEEQMALPASSFSGGFQIRVELAKVLLSEPNLLLLDEPTNYLDIVSLRWLERFLRSWKNELMVISHDREFMDKVTTHTMLIKRCAVRKIEGPSTKLYEQIAQDEEVYEQTRLNKEAKKKDMEVFINRFRAQASKATLVQSKIKALERLDIGEELMEDPDLDFKFRNAPFFAKTIAEIQNLGFDYCNDPDSRENGMLIQGLNLRIGKNDRIGVIGKNGKGKSTLLRLLAGELTPLEGSVQVSPNAAMGYFGQTNIQRLKPDLTVEQEVNSSNEILSRTQVRCICGTMMFDGDKALKQVSVLSGGEKSRVLLGKLLARPSNILLLDEPTNHLDQESVEAMIESLSSFEGAVIIVTHNERILRALATRLVVFQNYGPEVLEGNYEYFLEKIGWEEEIESRPTKANTKVAKTVANETTEVAPRAEPKLDKRARANLVQERAKALRPLEKEIKTLEDRICALEKELKTGDDALVDASRKSNSILITTLAKQTSETRGKIEEAFGKLESLSNSYDRLKAEYETKLN